MYLSNSGFQDEVRDSSFLYHTWRSSYFYVTFSIAKLVWILKRKTTKYLLILSGLHDCLDNRLEDLECPLDMNLVWMITLRLYLRIKSVCQQKRHIPNIALRISVLMLCKVDSFWFPHLSSGLHTLLESLLL